jgi:hypothetical protein
MDPIKEAFQKIKEEMAVLKDGIMKLSIDVNELKKNQMLYMRCP